MKCVRPKLFPHWGNYAYSQWGFRHRLKPRLLKMGFTIRQVERLEGLYFCRSFLDYLDDTGIYLNKRHNRLYYLARGMGYDRKERFFKFIERSRLFFCYYGDDGNFEGFQSPKKTVL